METTTFKISVPEEELETLKRKLSLTRFPDELDQAAWDYGAPLSDIERLAQYWQNGFDWRKTEESLNQLPQYRTNLTVEGFETINLHFIHKPSKVKNAIPLLFCHGWPGSYIEVTKLLPLLDGSQSGPAFHVVAPSLPNFGWSTGTKKKGWASKQHADILNQLMHKLGYKQYVTQGGDLGFPITRTIGKLYPDNCLASHFNMVRAKPPTWTANPLLALQNFLTPFSERDKSDMARTKWFQTKGSGYMHLQRTKPQTLGYAMCDSPVALLAWIYEKLHDWTDNYPWTDDEILTWVSIYWFSNAGPHASVRYYYESAGEDITSSVPRVKIGLAYFPKEIGTPPKRYGHTLGPVVFESEYSDGGHFAAWERPEYIAQDLSNMFGKGCPCESIVPGRSGFD